MKNKGGGLENLSKEEQFDAYVREVALEKLVAYCVAIDQKYEITWHVELIAKKLEEILARVLEGKSSRLILELPPRHGKSELATVKFPTWVLASHPEIPVIVSSYSAELAEDFGRKARDAMREPNYQALSKTRLRADTAAVGKWLTEEGGGYTATGVGGSITGRGFKIGIIDDPIKNREEADSQVYRDKIWNWFTSTFYTRQDGNGAIILILTRWHLDDLAGRLIEKQKYDKEAGLKDDGWEVIKFPAIAEKDEEFRKKGEPLWPQRFSLENLENIKNTIGDYDWESLYQQEPISSALQEFKREWFKYFEEQDLRNLKLAYTTTVDLAISPDQKANKTVVRTVGKVPDDPRWFLIDRSAGIMDPLQTIDAIFYHYERYRSKVFVETVGYQRALKYFLEEEMRKRQTYFNINELKRNTSTSKEIRIRGLVPLYKAGVIYHRRSDVELEKQLLTFPQGREDDEVDALASQLEAIQPTRTVPDYLQNPLERVSELEPLG